MDNQTQQSNPRFDEPTNQSVRPPVSEPTASQLPPAPVTPAKAPESSSSSRIQIPLNFTKKSSNKKPLLIIILLLVLGGSGYYIYSNVLKKPQSDAETVSTAAPDDSSTPAPSDSATATSSDDSTTVDPESEADNIDSSLGTINDDSFAESTMSDTEVGL